MITEGTLQRVTSLLVFVRCVCLLLFLVIFAPSPPTPFPGSGGEGRTGGWQGADCLFHAKPRRETL
ncbi:MAG: hypothetical protein ACKPHU_21835, partial [Planctomycetaceae bacterium]